MNEQAILKEFQRMPNVGPKFAADLLRLGFTSPDELKGQDAEVLYQRLCEMTGSHQDPCVLDTFRAVVHFAETGEPKKWWEFTPLRKAAK